MSQRVHAGRWEPYVGALLWLLVALPGAVVAQVAAEVGALSGTVTAQAEGLPARRLSPGDPVHVGERIETARRSQVELRFTDGGRLLLGPRSVFEVRHYQDEAGAGAALLRVTRGVFRFITGRIAELHREQFEMQLTTVTIGVRGTDFGGETDGRSARVVLLDSADGRPSAIEVANAHGRVRIDQAGFGTFIPDADSPPGEPERMRLDSVHHLARTLGQVQRLGLPRPR